MNFFLPSQAEIQIKQQIDFIPRGLIQGLMVGLVIQATGEIEFEYSLRIGNQSKVGRSLQMLSTTP